MGTNFYLESVEKTEACEHCGTPNAIATERHIGKSSAGWVFLLHVYPEENIRDLNDWIELFNSDLYKIRDEYGVYVSKVEMITIITKRSWNNLSSMSALDLERNHAQLGPNNLVRSKLGRDCIGHGDGTWDLIVGDWD